MRRLTLMALLILAGCEQAERAIGGARCAMRNGNCCRNNK
jgi:hypothetical protein